MKELAQILAGLKTTRDRSHYEKNEMVGQVTDDGYLDDPTAEQMLGFFGKFKSKW